MSLSDSLDLVRQEGPAWLDARRVQAADQLHRTGLPGRKVESWRFTPVGAIAQADFGEPDAGAEVRLRARTEAELPDDGCARIWIVNGRPLSLSGQLPAGVSVAELADCADDPDVRAHLGTHARAEYFAALNATSFARGLVLRIAPGARPERPVHVIHVTDGEGRSVVVTPRLLVLAGSGSEATLVETYLSRGAGKLLVNPVTEVVLADAAQLEHVRVADAPAGEAGTWYHTGSLAAHVERNAGYRSRVVTLGGALTRLELEVVLDGEGAECALLGVYHAGGREHVDHQTRIDHARPRATSIENYRGIVDGRGLAVFDGQIFVRKDAQHTVAHQENRNLILSDGAGVHTKPHLEIDADDVVCSHGATVGGLDDGQLFYLRARGIGPEQAEAMLTFAFVREVTDAIGHAPVRDWLERALLARLPRGEMVES